MVEITIDGIKVEAPEGSMVIQAAHKLGVYVPHFCYHKQLSVAANCRMCLVDVEKAPKALPACATPVTNGMVGHTRSENRSEERRAGTECVSTCSSRWSPTPYTKHTNSTNST